MAKKVVGKMMKAKAAMGKSKTCPTCGGTGKC